MFPARKCCRCQMPVTRVLYAKQWYTENKLTREQCPPVNSLYHAAFQNILEFRIIPFSMIQEISGCSSVLTADFSEINGFSSITTQENRDYITIIHHSIEGFFILCNIWDLLIHSNKLITPRINGIVNKLEIVDKVII